MEAIILAAGIGKRLEDKYFIKINNKTLLEHQYTKLSEFTNSIYIVYHDNRVKNFHSHLNVKWIHNPTHKKEESVKLAIQNSKNSCLITLADMINLNYQKYFKLHNTTFSYNQDQMPPVVINKNDFSKILTSNFNTIKEIITGDNIAISNYETIDIDYIEDVIKARKTIVIVGGGDLASATINLLTKSGYNVIVVEKQFPLAVRRSVSYCEAMYQEEKLINDITVKKANYQTHINILKSGKVPIISNDEFELNNFKYDLIIDITLRKTKIKYQSLSIGVGPGFTSPEDVSYVIESMRGDELGKVITNGCAKTNTKVPTTIKGFNTDRVLYSDRDGIFTSNLQIGSKITKDEIFGYIDDQPIYAKISGTIRGQIRPIFVKKGVKIGDVNPVGNNIDINQFSDKSLKIASSILCLVEDIL